MVCDHSLSTRATSRPDSARSGHGVLGEQRRHVGAELIRPPRRWRPRSRDERGRSPAVAPRQVLAEDAKPGERRDGRLRATSGCRTRARAAAAQRLHLQRVGSTEEASATPAPPSSGRAAAARSPPARSRAAAATSAPATIAPASPLPPPKERARALRERTYAAADATPAASGEERRRACRARPAAARSASSRIPAAASSTTHRPSSGGPRAGDRDAERADELDRRHRDAERGCGPTRRRCTLIAPSVEPEGDGGLAGRRARAPAAAGRRAERRGRPSAAGEAQERRAAGPELVEELAANPAPTCSEASGDQDQPTAPAAAVRFHRFPAHLHDGS